jgi:hypothetical protein
MPFFSFAMVCIGTSGRLSSPSNIAWTYAWFRLMGKMPVNKKPWWSIFPIVTYVSLVTPPHLGTNDKSLPSKNIGEHSFQKDEYTSLLTPPQSLAILSIKLNLKCCSVTSIPPSSE